MIAQPGSRRGSRAEALRRMLTGWFGRGSKDSRGARASAAPVSATRVRNVSGGVRAASPMTGRNATQTIGLQAPGAWRRYVAAGLLALGAVAVAWRAFDLQVVKRDFLTREGDKRHLRTIELPAFRGAIRDRRGEPLALSAPTDSIWVIPGDLLEAPDYVDAIGRLLGYKSGVLTRFLSERQDRQFLYLRRQMDPDEAARVIALKAPGVFAKREYRRYYPAGEVTSHVVGFCNIDGEGQEGIEAAQNKLLEGVAGSRQVVRDRAGRVVEDTEDFKEAQPGQDINLTIDLHLQYIAYRELKAAVAKYNAKGGIIVIADPQSGEILAMADQPGYNPNRPDDRDSAGLRNRAVTDSFEPGSTIKPLLVSQAFELNKFRPDSRVDTGPGYFKVGGWTIHDTHPHGDIDIAHVLSFSSNVGAAKIGLAMGAEAVHSGLQRFGIGEPVNLGLPGEAASTLRAVREWGEVATASASYGYGVSVNALHLIRAYSALAQDGLMPNLRIVDGGALVPPQRVISARTASQVRHLLEGVVAPDGTALKAAIPGYRVAGKTGTARKAAGGGYANREYLSVFIGMVPAEHPRLVGLVMIDDPQGGDYYGGLVAAPVFSTVMQAGLRLMQIPPDDATVPAPVMSPAINIDRPPARLTHTSRQLPAIQLASEPGARS
jgi:cell division protein FtsI (penicillin-binding protein 3)